MFVSKIHTGIVTNKLRRVVAVVALFGATAMSLGAAAPASAMKKCTTLGDKGYPACFHAPGSCSLPAEFTPDGELIWNEYAEGETAIIKGDVYVCEGGNWYYIGLTRPPSPPVHVAPVAPAGPALAPIS